MKRRKGEKPSRWEKEAENPDLSSSSRKSVANGQQLRDELLKAELAGEEEEDKPIIRSRS